MFKNTEPHSVELYDIDTNKRLYINPGDEINATFVEIRNNKIYVKLHESYLTTDEQYEIDLYLRG